MILLFFITFQRYFSRHLGIVPYHIIKVSGGLLSCSRGWLCNCLRRSSDTLTGPDAVNVRPKWRMSSSPDIHNNSRSFLLLRMLIICRNHLNVPKRSWACSLCCTAQHQRRIRNGFSECHKHKRWEAIVNILDFNVAALRSGIMVTGLNHSRWCRFYRRTKLYVQDSLVDLLLPWRAPETLLHRICLCGGHFPTDRATWMCSTGARDWNSMCKQIPHLVSISWLKDLLLNMLSPTLINMAAWRSGTMGLTRCHVHLCRSYRWS
jgi:hypothetical protein